MDKIFDFSGKVALVVGVGGIGRAQAIAFAEHGADIVAADYRTEIAETVAKEAEALGRKALAITVDVAEESSVLNMASVILKKFPRIDILVNTAGTTYRSPNSGEIPINEWQKVFDVNVRGTWLCCQAIGRQMMKQHSGRIINVSSVVSTYGAKRGGAAYGPSKGAVNTLTKTLALEWAQHNILVNAIAPTIIETDFTKDVLAKPEDAQWIKSRIPLGRWGVPEDIVGPTLFFASEASSYVTGQILFIDGGLTTQLY